MMTSARREKALADAADADRRLADGERLLLGVPIAVKADVDITGKPTAFGYPGEFPAKTEDSEIVRRLHRYADFPLPTSTSGSIFHRRHSAGTRPSRCCRQPGLRNDLRSELPAAFAWPWNVLGWPSINIPAGFSRTGLPIGAQLMGNKNTERRW